MKRTLFAVFSAIVPMALIIIGGADFGMYVNYFVAVFACGLGMYIARNEDSWMTIDLVAGFVSSIVAVLYLAVSCFFEVSYITTTIAVLYFSIYAWLWLYLCRDDMSEKLQIYLGIILALIDIAAVVVLFWLIKDMIPSDAYLYIFIGIASAYIWNKVIK